MDTPALPTHIEYACQRLLNQQNRSFYDRKFGSFGADIAAQTAVYPLAWLLDHQQHFPHFNPDRLREAIEAGLMYAAFRQQPYGAFGETHVFAVTAQMIYPLLLAYRAMLDSCSTYVRVTIARSLREAAEFLCEADESDLPAAHQQAEAALSLLACADAFGDNSYEEPARALLNRVLLYQSAEGWFREDGGADPSYQTRCLDALARIRHLRPEYSGLPAALKRAAAFLAWFVHPDGSFGGEYGSQRAALYYPGGLANLAHELPEAASISQSMMSTLPEGRTTAPLWARSDDLAPLLSSYTLAFNAPPSFNAEGLPCYQQSATEDFVETGLYIRSTPRYYAVLGASSGGVLKVFDKGKRTALWDDAGYSGQLEDGRYVTTHHVDHGRRVHFSPTVIELEAPFFEQQSAGNRRVPISLLRRVEFGPEQVTITDTLKLNGKVKLRWLECGRPLQPRRVDVQLLNSGERQEERIEIGGQPS